MKAKTGILGVETHAVYMTTDWTTTDWKVKTGILGVGKGGILACNHMIASGLEDVMFIAADTDAKTLAHTRSGHTVLLGPTRCKGSGTNGDADVGRRAVEESLPAITDAVAGYDLVFAVAGMGGGRASGEYRAGLAAVRALACPLLKDAPIHNSRALLYSVTSNYDLSGDELWEISNVLCRVIHKDAYVACQEFFDDSMGDEVVVTIIGTQGIDAGERR